MRLLHITPASARSTPRSRLHCGVMCPVVRKTQHPPLLGLSCALKEKKLDTSRVTKSSQSYTTHGSPLLSATWTYFWHLFRNTFHNTKTVALKYCRPWERKGEHTELRDSYRRGHSNCCLSDSTGPSTQLTSSNATLEDFQAGRAFSSIPSNYKQKPEQLVQVGKTDHNILHEIGIVNGLDCNQTFNVVSCPSLRMILRTILYMKQATT